MLKVVTPSDFTNEKIEVTTEDIRNYNNYISKLIDSYIEGINVGLSFFKIEARKNKESNNQIDFYDLSGKQSRYITSQKFQCPKTKAEETLAFMMKSMDQINIDFGSKLRKISIVVRNCKEHVNYDIDVTVGGVTRRVELGINEKGLIYAKAIILGQRDYGQKVIDVFDVTYPDGRIYQSFNVDLNSHDGLCSKRGKDTSKREITYYFNFNSPYNCSVSSDYCEAFGEYLDDDSKYAGICTEYYDYREDFMASSPVRLAKFNRALLRVPAIMAHPRAKETINKAEEIMNREIPGIVDFFRNNFALYRTMTSYENIRDEEFDKKEFLSECDFSKKGISFSLKK